MGLALPGRRCMRHLLAPMFWRFAHAGRVHAGLYWAGLSTQAGAHMPTAQHRSLHGLLSQGAPHGRLQRPL
jgi:hypothetical protein